MSNITPEYIDQLKKEAVAQLSEKVKKNLEAQAGRALTSQQVVQINNQINMIPMSSFVGYLMYGIINSDNLDLFTRMSADRRDIAKAFMNGAAPQQLEPVAPVMPEVHEPTPILADEPQPSTPVISEEPSPAVPTNEQPQTSVCLIGLPPVVQLFSAFFNTVKANNPALRHFTLVEMIGEQFTSKVANGQSCLVTTSDLEATAVQQFISAPTKSIIFVVDPSVEPITYHHLVSQTGDDGNIRNYSVHTTVSQAELIRSFCQLLQQPDARNLLQNLHSLYFAAINTDLLGNPGQRDQEALRRLRAMNQGEFNLLIRNCQENGVNAATNGLPVLFTFCFGHAQENVTHQYAPDDVNKLVELLNGNIIIADN